MIFSLYSGTDITEFIGRILQTTVEYKRLPTYGGGYLKQDISGASDSGASKIPYTYKIIANVENLEYDLLRQDYQKKINFKIKKPQESRATNNTQWQHLQVQDEPRCNHQD